MNIYLSALSDDLIEIQEKLTSDIEAWLDENKLEYRLVTREDYLAVHLLAKQAYELKTPLNFLNRLAKEQKCDFVVGLIGEDDSKTDVCYFGHEEGRPDMFEIANYLGL